MRGDATAEGDEVVRVARLERRVLEHPVLVTCAEQVQTQSTAPERQSRDPTARRRDAAGDPRGRPAPPPATPTSCAKQCCHLPERIQGIGARTASSIAKSLREETVHHSPQTRGSEWRARDSLTGNQRNVQKPSPAPPPDTTLPDQSCRNKEEETPESVFLAS